MLDTPARRTPGGSPSARFRRPFGHAIALPLAATVACGRAAPERLAIRLVDAFDAKRVEASPGKPAAAPQRTEWRFDGPAPRPGPRVFAATRGWEPGPGVSGLAVRDGLLVGRTTSAFPILRLERNAGLDDADQLHSIEIRLRVSAGSNLSLATRPGANIVLEQELVAFQRRLPGTVTSPVLAGGKLQSYVITPPAPVTGSRIRHVLIRPSDAAGAEFAIESVRLVFEREHLAGVPSGVSWQGLRDVFRETIVTRSPERVGFEVTLPSRPLLDLALGTPEDDPVTFRVGVRRGDQDVTLLSHTVTTPHRWERRVVDLAPFAGARVTLSLSAATERDGTLAFWGAPAVRQRPGGRASQGPPQAVILIQGDTLRSDHLDAYGYDRETAPTLRRLAEEGVLFRHAVTQTSWTKAATPAVLASLYPSSHGVHQITDRLPASATTIAELFRDAGYATLAFSSVPFTGQYTNLHQGFEELHESESTAGRAGPRGSKTSREYVDRLTAWIEDHRDVPFFVFLHVFDPHSPYEPNRPYDTRWAAPSRRAEYLASLEVLKKAVADPFLAQRGMATREELIEAGLAPDVFVQYSKDWYDGSIRGMDAELGRLVERLGALGLAERSLIAFYADHGEEFHDHGRMWHGQSVYGEMIRVPLIFWGPGRLGRGVRVEEPVQLIDVMPTLAELSGLRPPEAAQGQSLRPLLAVPVRGGVRADAWKPRPVISEKQPMGGGTEHPGAGESYAIADGGFKLIHNVVRPPGKPEFELFDFFADPLDQRNLAAEHPEVVTRLARGLEAWRQQARAARLASDSEATKGLTQEQLERLRSLGYVK